MSFVVATYVPDTLLHFWKRVKSWEEACSYLHDVLKDLPENLVSFMVMGILPSEVANTMMIQGIPIYPEDIQESSGDVLLIGGKITPAASGFVVCVGDIRNEIVKAQWSRVTIWEEITSQLLLGKEMLEKNKVPMAFQTAKVYSESESEKVLTRDGAPMFPKTIFDRTRNPSLN